MTSLRAGVGAIQMDGFSMRTERAEGSIVATLVGNADMAVQERLKALLDDISIAAKSPGTGEVVFDWRELYFMNSSCLSLVLRFINGVLELPQHARYKIRFRSSPNLRWQQKSLRALLSYAQQLVVIE